jgi:ABC-type transport system substrate-binding protein
MCEPANIRINIKIWPAETYWKQAWRMGPFFVSNWTARPTVHGTLHQFFHQDSFNQENPGGLNDIYNTSHFVNPTLSELLDLGMSELNPQKRREYYIMAQAIIMENAGWITAYNSNFIRARLKKLHNLTLHPTKICDMSRCWKSA